MIIALLAPKSLLRIVEEVNKREASMSSFLKPFYSLSQGDILVRTGSAQ